VFSDILVIGCIPRFHLAGFLYKLLTNILLFSYIDVIYPPTDIRGRHYMVSILAALLNNELKNIKVGNTLTHQLYIFLKPGEILKTNTLILYIPDI
jgi:hypothetical protein